MDRLKQRKDMEWDNTRSRWEGDERNDGAKRDYLLGIALTLNFVSIKL